MRASLVITCYELAEYLPTALESAQAQSRPFDEVVVVDDGSSQEIAVARTCIRFGVRALRISNRGWAYWLVYPTERRLVPKIKRFREWLIAEMSKAQEEWDGGWGHEEVPTAAE